METGTFGEHLTIDGYGGEYAFLKDREVVEHCLIELPKLLTMHPLIHPMVQWAEPNDLKDPGGWSGYVLIAESHISIHTFPNRRFLRADVYSCRNGTNPNTVIQYFTEKFGLTDTETHFIKRGSKYPVRNIGRRHWSGSVGKIGGRVEGERRQEVFMKNFSSPKEDMMNVNKQVRFHEMIDGIRTPLKLSAAVLAACVWSLSWTTPMTHAQTIDDSGAKVKIKANLMKFKGGVRWEINDGQVKPVLTGELTLKNARGLCGRMRMDYFAKGHVLLTTKYGGENACPKNNKRQRWSVSLEPYDSNKLHGVKVSIEKKTASKDWSVIGSQTVQLKPITYKVKITGKGFDFGGKSFALGAPTNAGVLVWSWGSGQITPSISGYLHIKDAASACVRLQIKYFSVEGNLLETKNGENVCASDNSHWYKQVTLNTYSDWKIASVKINLQTLRADGSWRTIGDSSSRYVRAHSGSSIRLTGG